MKKLVAALLLVGSFYGCAPAYAQEICMTPAVIIEKNPNWSEFAYFAEGIADVFTHVMTDGGADFPESLKSFKDIRAYKHNTIQNVIVQWYDKDGCATEVTARLPRAMFVDTWKKTQELLGTLNK